MGPVKRLMKLVRAGQERPCGEHNSDLAAHDAAAPDLEQLRRERDGYKAAYEATAHELWLLRDQAGPYVRRKEEVDRHGGKRSIFVVTLPKSGTMFLGHTLTKTLGHSFSRTLVTPTFPKNQVWSAMLHDFLRGGIVSVSHMEGDTYNLSTIEQVSTGPFKMVLHLRDPRAAVYSWAHHAYRLKDDPVPPDAFVHKSWQRVRSAPMSGIIDYVIKVQYDHMLAWTLRWIEVIDRKPPQLDILVTLHDELLADSEGLVRKILDFYGLTDPVQLAEKSTGTHFRRGDNEEWREAFSPEQYKRVTDPLPLEVRRRFGWE